MNSWWMVTSAVSIQIIMRGLKLCILKIGILLWRTGYILLRCEHFRFLTTNKTKDNSQKQFSCQFLPKTIYGALVQRNSKCSNWKMETECPIKVLIGITEIESGIVTTLLITGPQKSTHQGEILQAVELCLSCEHKMKKWIKVFFVIKLDK